MRTGPYSERVSAASNTRVRDVARYVAATIGAESFRAMATHLAHALEADCVLVGEFVPGPVQRVITLAAQLEGEPGSLAFDLAGSACASIAATGQPCLCHENAQKQFPDDQMLRRVNAQAFVGIALTNSSGEPVGVMMATYRSPVASLPSVKSILEIFAPRASSELRNKQEQERLLKCEQRYRAFVTQSADGLWRVEFEQPISTKLPEKEQLELVYKYGYLAECNDAMARYMGLDHAEQAVGRRIIDFFPGANPTVRENLLELIRSDYQFTARDASRIGPDGRHLYLVRSVLGIIEGGLLQRVWGVTHDITKFKNVQRALDASEQRMVELFEAIQLLALVLDLSATVQFSNNYFAESTGWRSDDLKGKSYFDLLVPAEERPGLEAKFAAAIAGPIGPIHFESTLLGRDGRRWHVAWDSTVLRDEEGNAKLIANIGRDITQEKALEAQLRQAQKLESVGRLAGGIAHDFNNLLTVISGYTARFLNKRSPADPEYAGLTEIQNAASKGAELTHQLLSFSRRRPYQPEVLNLNTIVERDASMLRHTLGEKIEFLTNLDPSLGPVRADPGQISQVILNLSVNARDAMPNGGKLIITSYNASLSGDQGSMVPGVPSGDYVQLTITDTGTGMTEEALDHLFEPFFTTKGPGKGSGLGLSIAYGIVQQSGGCIRVESELGRGTSVRIFLPRTQLESPAAPAQENRKAAVPGGTETILLVEDRQEVRILAANILRTLGYKVLEADGPSQALEIAEDESRIDLMLTDLIMPEMPGTELAERIKLLHAETKIAIMSGSTGPERLKVPFLPKPFTPQSLASIVRQVLDHSQPVT
jgi:two-component system, cell cycle sensor histidine kinase and response regulator CckA